MSELRNRERNRPHVAPELIFRARQDNLLRRGEALGFRHDRARENLRGAGRENVGLLQEAWVGLSDLGVIGLDKMRVL